jgi:multisubunit Na+/H+ antiporter MnhE subunit
MTSDQGLHSDQISGLGIGAIIAIIVIGLLIAYFMTRLVVRIIVLALVIVLAVVVYQQRQSFLRTIDEHAKQCNATFFGVQIQSSNATVRQACAEIAKKTPH